MDTNYFIMLSYLMLILGFLGVCELTVQFILWLKRREPRVTLYLGKL